MRNKVIRTEIREKTVYVPKTDKYTVYTVLCGICNETEVAILYDEDDILYQCDKCTENEENNQAREKFDYLIGARIVDLVIDWGNVEFIKVIDSSGKEHKISVSMDDE